MKYVLAVMASGVPSAHHFAQALTRQGHEISQVFFYKDGVLSPHENWAAFNAPLIACRTSCETRGVHSSPFQMGTLTQFFDALLKADRYVVFS